MLVFGFRDLVTLCAIDDQNMLMFAMYYKFNCFYASWTHVVH